MGYQCALIAVRDVRKSLAFYQKWFNMEVEVDLGENIGLKGGLALQENFAGLAHLPAESILERSHNMELYFDTEDFDGLANRLEADASIEWVHHAVEYPWLQRVLRIYDLDHHILEIGESMISIFKRLHGQGKSVEEVAQLTQHPVEYVRTVLEAAE